MAHVLRVPKLDLASILAQQNPQIDLRIEAYDTSTRNFLKAVSRYTQNAQAEITRRKTAHTNEKHRIAEKIQQYENETNACKVKELELIAGERRRDHSPGRALKATRAGERARGKEGSRVIRGRL